MVGHVNEHIKFSIVIPAHNEEKYIEKCLNSIKSASQSFKDQVEIIVVLNRCTDRTEEIAREHDCVIVTNNDKNLSKIRNAGAQAARGEIIVTIDADSVMSEHTLADAETMLASGKYIGGGASGKFERVSLGILLSALVLIVPLAFKYGAISVGIFWCYKKDFDAIGGFNENLLMAEDADFAKRLKNWGKKHGKAFGTLKNAMITSCRKFDKHGDWILIKRPKLVLAYLRGTDRSYADESYYENQHR